MFCNDIIYIITQRFNNNKIEAVFTQLNEFKSYFLKCCQKNQSYLYSHNVILAKDGQPRKCYIQLLSYQLDLIKELWSVNE